MLTGRCRWGERRGRGAERRADGRTGRIFHQVMVSPSPLLDDFERRDQQRVLAHRSYAAALERFAALWTYARAVRPDIGADWETDILADIAVAHAVNGLSPRA